MAFAPASVQLLLGTTVVILGSAIFQWLHPTRLPPKSEADDQVNFIDPGDSPVCTSLSQALPGRVFTRQSAIYRASVSSYFSERASEQIPRCIVRPADTNQVSVAVKTLKAYYESPPERDSVKVAVRSGGHAYEGDWSSITGGIVLDLSLLNAVEVASDRQTTRLGTAARWSDVSSKLDAMGLAIAGGRNSHVGVGGLMLGGGISFFSPQIGMVCDNVVEYQLVLADGKVVHASVEQHPDLFRALKGGTNNFGVVTYFVARAFPGASIWGGYLYYMWFQAPKVLRAFYDFNRAEAFDPHAAGPILALGYDASIGLKALACSVVYTKPESWPKVWVPFQKIWSVWSTAKVQSLTAVTDEIDAWSPHHKRPMMLTTTVKNDLELLLHLERVFDRSLEKVKHIKGLVWSLTLQPLTRGAFTDAQSSANVLGLDRARLGSQDAFVIVLATASWKYAKDDATVSATSLEVIEEIEAYAKQRDLFEHYKYVNYAARPQKPFEGYGQKNLEFMRQVSRRYDPDGFFQQAVPGGFKLF